MDILYHAVVGVAISKIYRTNLEIPAAICSILPDIIGTGPYYYFKLIQSSQGPLNRFPERLYYSLVSNTFTNSIDKTVYRIAHSGFTALIFGVLTYLLFPSTWHIYTLSYVSHILIDIPTHDGDHATRFAYPFSDIHVVANNWALHMKSFIGFWVILLFIVTYLYWQ